MKMNLTGRAAGMSALLLVAGAGGCDWRDIDALAERTPVLTIGAPDDFGPKDDFGRVVLPITAAPDDEGVVSQLVVAGVGETGLAVVSLDGKGKAKTRNIKSPSLSMLDGYPVPVVAEIVGSNPVQVLVGAPVLDMVVGGQLFVAPLAAGGAVTRFTMSTEQSFGIGLAAANLVGGAAADYVVLAAETMRVYVDGVSTGMLPPFTSSDACPIGLTASRTDLARQLPVSRPVLIGHWVGPGSDPQVAVGTPAGPTGKGSVSFFSISATAITCLQTVAGAEALFGHAVASGDVNGDGAADLVIGAPPKNAYVVLGPLGPTPSLVPLPIDMDNARRFGAAVAAVNIDGAGPDEVVVTDSGATVKGVELAGEGYVYSLSTGTPSRSASLADYSPQAGATYGATVNALSFCSTAPCAATNKRRLVVVGAAAEIFTYFKLSASDTDPRQP